MGPGVRDDQLGETFALDVVDHLQDRREAELLQLVFGQLELADGREVFDRDAGDGDRRTRGDDDEIMPLGDDRGGEVA